MIAMTMAATLTETDKKSARLSPEKQASGKSTDCATRLYLCAVGRNLLVEGAAFGKNVSIANRKLALRMPRSINITHVPRASCSIAERRPRGGTPGEFLIHFRNASSRMALSTFLEGSPQGVGITRRTMPGAALKIDIAAGHRCFSFESTANDRGQSILGPTRLKYHHSKSTPLRRRNCAAHSQISAPLYSMYFSTALAGTSLSQVVGPVSSMSNES
jgi:hypothetical protein